MTILGELADAISRLSRNKKLQPILDELLAGSSVIDVGVWCRMPEPHVNENWIEKRHSGRGVLIAVGIQNMGEFSRKYPLVVCVQADGAALPFKRGSVDVAFANAVLEHVWPGKQSDFARELARVSRKWSLLAVPDRLCPFEVHTRIPLAHWLPWWRGVFRLLGQEYWASPKNLSLFSKPSLQSLLNGKARDDSGTWEVARSTFVGVPLSIVAEFRHAGGDDLENEPDVGTGGDL